CMEPDLLGKPSAAFRDHALASRPRDLFRAVAERPEDLVGFGGRRTAKKGLTKERVDVFPNNLSFFGDFEKEATDSFSDQRVAVGQALGAAHTRREEVPGRLILILPDDLVRGGIDLNHP